MSEVVGILSENLDFRGQSSTFGAEYTSHMGLLSPKNNALTLPEHLQSNFEKVPKMTFLVPK